MRLNGFSGNAGNLIKQLKSRIKKLIGKLSGRRKQLEQTQSTVQTAHDGAEAIEDASSSTDEIEKVVKVGAETTEIAASIPS